ncbi:cupredoxin domain-containing protein [Patescibacteria group bacterium AH-259-L05]|nr:cupredoxin domain-containing protein [Patescibacteria group bacterium AH-259-L05]
MKQSTRWTIVTVLVLVALGIVLVSVSKQPASAPDGAAAGEEAGMTKGEAAEKARILEVLENAEEVIPGGSLVTDKGEVISETGKVVSNEALPGSPSAPRQSRALEDAEVPPGAVTLTVSPAGIEPSEFSVNAKTVVTLAVSSTEQTHVFKFDDPLQAVALGLASGETRAITFKAPAKGDYRFFCDVPGHRGRGESGVMHVE